MCRCQTLPTSPLSLSMLTTATTTPNDSSATTVVTVSLHKPLVLDQIDNKNNNKNSLSHHARQVSEETLLTASLSSSSLEDELEEDALLAKTTTTRPLLPKHVHFSTVQVREYPTVLGDNAGGSGGPPVQLGWQCLRETTFDSLDHYLECHWLGRAHRSHEELYLTVQQRTKRLLYPEYGDDDDDLSWDYDSYPREHYTLRDLYQASQQAQHVRAQRFHSWRQGRWKRCVGHAWKQFQHQHLAKKKVAV